MYLYVNFNLHVSDDYSQQRWKLLMNTFINWQKLLLFIVSVEDVKRAADHITNWMVNQLV